MKVSLISKNFYRWTYWSSCNRPMKCPLLCNNCIIFFFSSNLLPNSSLRKLEVILVEVGLTLSVLSCGLVVLHPWLQEWLCLIELARSIASLLNWWKRHSGLDMIQPNTFPLLAYLKLRPVPASSVAKTKLSILMEKTAKLKLKKLPILKTPTMVQKTSCVLLQYNCTWSYK